MLCSSEIVVAGSVASARGGEDVSASGDAGSPFVSAETGATLGALTTGGGT